MSGKNKKIKWQEFIFSIQKENNSSVVGSVRRIKDIKNGGYRKHRKGERKKGSVV